MICRNRSRAFQFKSVVIIASLLVSMHTPYKCSCVYSLLWFFSSSSLSLCDISCCKTNTSGWMNKHALIRVCNEHCAHTRTQIHTCTQIHTQTNLLVHAKWLKCLPDTVEPLSFTFEFCFSTYFSKNYTQTNVTR